MTIPSNKALRRIEEFLNKDHLESLSDLLKPVYTDSQPTAPEIPGLRIWSKEAQHKRLQLLKDQLTLNLPYLSGEEIFDAPETLKGNIENYIGMTQVPTGIVGPLRINGTEARGDFYVPMATTEGALIASYNRGAIAATQSGGVISVCLTEGVQRTPSFKFNSFAEAGMFLVWAMENIDAFKMIVSQKTAHGVLEDVKPHVDGNQVTLIFEYTTGDASGQNMVTICTNAVCQYILKEAPVKPKTWLIEGNLSGDKKASAISFISVRGKKVTAEAVIKKELVAKILNTEVAPMIDAWRIAIMNGIQSGTIGVNFHFSNCLTAIFLACGQDTATVSEAAVGTTRCEKNDEGDLYICVTLPNLIIGTVGGGTRFPTQRECLEILGCNGSGKARKLAEICAASALCGELSIIASMAAGDFARAHALFGRKTHDKT